MKHDKRDGDEPAARTKKKGQHRHPDGAANPPLYHMDPTNRMLDNVMRNGFGTKTTIGRLAGA